MSDAPREERPDLEVRETADLNLGSGVTARWLEYSPAGQPDAPRPAGLMLEHPAATPSGRCHGAVFWWRPPQDLAAGRALWRIVQREPLTLEPSLRCQCGYHGWIRDGRWVAG